MSSMIKESLLPELRRIVTDSHVIMGSLSASYRRRCWDPILTGSATVEEPAVDDASLISPPMRYHSRPICKVVLLVIIHLFFEAMSFLR